MTYIIQSPENFDFENISLTIYRRIFYTNLMRKRVKKVARRSASRRQSSRGSERDNVVLVRRFTYVTFALLGLFLLTGLYKSSAQSAYFHFDSPLLATKIDSGTVLGDENEKEGQKDQEIKKPEEKKESNTSEQVKQNQEKAQEQAKKSETELETKSGLKIKTKVEDNGVTKAEIEQGRFHLKYTVVNGQVVKTVTDDTGKKVETTDKEKTQVEDQTKKELENEGIEIASDEGKPSFFKNNVGARTEFPLSIDSTTKKLTVTTTSGSKEVTVLPDEAINRLLAIGILNSVESQATSSGQAGQTLVDLKVKDGEPVYEVKGDKTYNFLGLFPVSQPVDTVVSARTGDVLSSKKSFLTNLISMLSR